MRGAALARALSVNTTAAAAATASSSSSASCGDDGGGAVDVGVEARVATAASRPPTSAAAGCSTATSASAGGSLSQDLTARYLALSCLAALVKVRQVESDGQGQAIHGLACID